MYKCDCGNEVTLSSEQWSKLAENRGGVEKSPCSCGETLVIYGDRDMFEDHWHVCHVEFI